MKKIGQIPGVLGRLVRSYRFPLAAFLLPLFIRTMPDILVGPYPIGWDTIAFYVPNTLDRAAGKKTGFPVCNDCLLEASSRHWTKVFQVSQGLIRIFFSLRHLACRNTRTEPTIDR